MRSRTWTRLGWALTAVVAVGLAAVSLNAGEDKPLPPTEGRACGVATAAKACGDGPCTHDTCPKPCGPGGRCKQTRAHLEQTLADLDAAVAAAAQAVERADSSEALAQLERARVLIAATRERLKACGPACPMKAAAGPADAAQAADVPVNVRCPMMGTKLDPANVPSHLKRQFEGRTVGFCCSGCPDAWDKLTPEQRRERLRAAIDVPR